MNSLTARFHNLLRDTDSQLRPGRVVFYSLLPLLAVLSILSYDVAAGHPPFNVYGQLDVGDYTAFAAAGRIARSNEIRHLYDPRLQWNTEQALVGSAGSYHQHVLAPFSLPPVAAYIFVPFALLPYLVGGALWMALSMALIAVSIRVLWPFLPNLHRYGYGTIAFLGLANLPATKVLSDGENSAVCLQIVAAGLRLLLARRDRTAGAVIAADLFFKPQLFLLLPVLLLLQRRWRALGAFTIASAALGGISLALVGFAGLHGLIQLVATVAKLDNAAARDQLHFSLFGLSYVLMPLLPAVLGRAAAALLIAAGLAMLAWWGRTALQPARLNPGREFALLYAGAVLVTALVNPHLFAHDAIILLLPVLVLFDFAPHRISIHTLLVATFLLTWSVDFINPLLASAPWPMPILTAPWVVVPLSGLFVVCQRLLQRKNVALGTSRTVSQNTQGRVLA